jgi:hypothetical protein
MVMVKDGQTVYRDPPILPASVSRRGTMLERQLATRARFRYHRDR